MNIRQYIQNTERNKIVLEGWPMEHRVLRNEFTRMGEHGHRLRTGKKYKEIEN